MMTQRRGRVRRGCCDVDDDLEVAECLRFDFVVNTRRITSAGSVSLSNIVRRSRRTTSSLITVRRIGSDEMGNDSRWREREPRQRAPVLIAHSLRPLSLSHSLSIFPARCISIYCYSRSPTIRFSPVSAIFATGVDISYNRSRTDRHPSNLSTCSRGSIRVPWCSPSNGFHARLSKALRTLRTPKG